jgi:hypothetical protein
VHSELVQIEDFDSVWDNFLETGQNGFVTYDSAHPKHEFLTYLVSHKSIVLHGSKDVGIDLLVPRKPPGEGANAIKGVWATDDANFSIFWATLVRDNLTEIDVDTETNTYFACLKEACESEEIWEEGVVYLMDGDPFYEVENSCQVSLLPVQPLGKLVVGPGHFPLASSVETRATVDEISGSHHVKELIRDLIDVGTMRKIWSTDSFRVGLETDGVFTTVCRFYFRSLPLELGIGEEAYSAERLILNNVEQIHDHKTLIRSTVE